MQHWLKTVHSVLFSRECKIIKNSHKNIKKLSITKKCPCMAPGPQLLRENVIQCTVATPYITAIADPPVIPLLYSVSSSSSRNSVPWASSVYRTQSAMESTLSPLIIPTLPSHRPFALQILFLFSSFLSTPSSRSLANISSRIWCGDLLLPGFSCFTLNGLMVKFYFLQKGSIRRDAESGTKTIILKTSANNHTCGDDRGRH